MLAIVKSMAEDTEEAEKNLWLKVGGKIKHRKLISLPSSHCQPTIMTKLYICHGKCSPTLFLWKLRPPTDAHGLRGV